MSKDCKRSLKPSQQNKPSSQNQNLTIEKAKVIEKVIIETTTKGGMVMTDRIATKVIMIHDVGLPPKEADTITNTQVCMVVQNLIYNAIIVKCMDTTAKIVGIKI